MFSFLSTLKKRLYAPPTWQSLHVIVLYIPEFSFSDVVLMYVI